MPRSGATGAKGVEAIAHGAGGRVPALLSVPEPEVAKAMLVAQPGGVGELAAARGEAARLAALLAERDASLERARLVAQAADNRVRNSLQIVTSVLMRQATAAAGRIEGRALVQACNRVQAIAHAHGLLHRAGGAELLQIHDYLSSLCSDLRQSLLVDGTQRSLELEAGAMQLRAERAVPLALVTNELVTNAFRHAFPDQRRGKVLVQFVRLSPDLCRLIVADDGIGLRSWKMRGRASGLGARIVGAMVQQLRGRLEMRSDRGTRFTIEVPVSQSG